MELFKFYDPIVVGLQGDRCACERWSDKVNNDQGGWGGDIDWREGRKRRALERRRGMQTDEAKHGEWRGPLQTFHRKTFLRRERERERERERSFIDNQEVTEGW
jgi:hypothetical protein